MTSDERWQRYFQIRDGVLTGKTAHDIAYYHMQALCNKLLSELGRLDGTNAARCAVATSGNAADRPMPV